MKTSKPKHTSGPWIEDGEGNEYVLHTGKGKFKEIATVQCDKYEDLLLIAAAPEMFEALETVLFGLTDDVTNNNGHVDFGALVPAVQAAIRKAKGETV
jgi:hypothetical protein